MIKLRYIKRTAIVASLMLSFIAGLSGCGIGDSAGGGETLDTFDLVVETVNDEISKGTDGKIVMTVTDEISDDDLKNINHSIDTMQGNVTSITTYNKANSGKRKIELDFERSDAMYVYDHIIDGKEIPEDKDKAIELEKACKAVLKKTVKNGMTDYEKELAIHDYIVNNCIYSKSDKGDDTEYMAYGVLINKKAVCSGYAAAMNLLLKCSGVECQIVSGKAYAVGHSNGEMENHAWNQVKLNGEWYNVDATWDDPVGDEDTLSHEFFNVTDDILRKTHIWDEAKYEKCNKMTFNYFKHKGALFSDKTSLETYLKSQIMSGNKTVDCALVNLSLVEEDLAFLFQVKGVENVGYSMTDMPEYQILVVYINRTK